MLSSNVPNVLLRNQLLQFVVCICFTHAPQGAALRCVALHCVIVNGSPQVTSDAMQGSQRNARID